MKFDGQPVDMTPWFTAYGFPKPEREVRFHPTRRWRWDYALMERKIAIEVNGDIWAYRTKGRIGGHQGRGQLRDFEKMNQGQILGWMVLQFTPDQFKTGEAAIVIGEALKSKTLARSSCSP